MSLADELAGRTYIPKHAGNRISPLGPWSDDGKSPFEHGKLYGHVVALCREIGSGITSEMVSRLTGIRRQAVSRYLSLMQDRGFLAVEFIIKPSGPKGGRPQKVYRAGEDREAA